VLRRLGEAVTTHPRLVVAGALVLVAIAGIGGIGVADKMKVGGFDDPSSESSRAQDLRDDLFADTANLVLEVSGPRDRPYDPEVLSAVSALERYLDSRHGVRVIGSRWWLASADPLTSDDGRSGLLLAHVSGDTEQRARRTRKLVEHLPVDPAVQVRVGGPLGITDETEHRVKEDLVTSESIALPVLLVLLILAFGGLVAALMPLAVGVFAILMSSLVLLGLAQVTDVSVYALTAATAFGLGLAIDFALLLVSRVREERAAGHGAREAIVEAVAAAGHPIVFSATTVGLAMAGLLVFPTYFLRSVGLAAIAVVGVAVVGAVVVLPALLALAGDRIDSLTLIRRRNAISADSPFWRRTAAAVMRRPARAALPVAALLVFVATPVRHIDFAPADERALPTDSAAREMTTHLRHRYPADPTQAVTVVAPPGDNGLLRLSRELSRLPGAAAVAGPFGRFSHGRRLSVPSRTAAEVAASGGYLHVFPASAAESDAAQDLVRSIRALPQVSRNGLLVGGPTAVLIDGREAIMHRLWLALVLIATAMFGLMFLFTGSVVVPLKALLLNVLVLGGVLGGMVWLFQQGNLVGHIDVTAAPLNLGMVVLLCTIVFSLSMDYEIFLLSRIKEARDRGADTLEATVEGLGRVGRIVSAAAALLTVTLFSFSLGLSFMKMFGIGTGLAILVDATLVRGVLVPAFMAVAGDLNWWAPRPLRRLLR
jgi:RND superfamily putative drug exporter